MIIDMPCLSRSLSVCYCPNVSAACSWCFLRSVCWNVLWTSLNVRASNQPQSDSMFLLLSAEGDAKVIASQIQIPLLVKSWPKGLNPFQIFPCFSSPGRLQSGSNRSVSAKSLKSTPDNPGALGKLKGNWKHTVNHEIQQCNMKSHRKS